MKKIVFVSHTISAANAIIQQEMIEKYRKVKVDKLLKNKDNCASFTGGIIRLSKVFGFIGELITRAVTSYVVSRDVECTIDDLCRHICRVMGVWRAHPTRWGCDGEEVLTIFDNIFADFSAKKLNGVPAAADLLINLQQAADELQNYKDSGFVRYWIINPVDVVNSDGEVIAMTICGVTGVDSSRAIANVASHDENAHGEIEDLRETITYSLMSDQDYAVLVNNKQQFLGTLSIRDGDMVIRYT